MKVNVLLVVFFCFCVSLAGCNAAQIARTAGSLGALGLTAAMSNQGHVDEKARTILRNLDEADQEWIEQSWLSEIKQDVLPVSKTTQMPILYTYTPEAELPVRVSLYQRDDSIKTLAMDMAADSSGQVGLTAIEFAETNEKEHLAIKEVADDLLTQLKAGIPVQTLNNDMGLIIGWYLSGDKTGRILQSSMTGEPVSMTRRPGAKRDVVIAFQARGEMHYIALQIVPTGQPGQYMFKNMMHIEPTTAEIAAYESVKRLRQRPRKAAKAEAPAQKPTAFATTAKKVEAKPELADKPAPAAEPEQAEAEEPKDVLSAF